MPNREERFMRPQMTAAGKMLNAKTSSTNRRSAEEIFDNIIKQYLNLLTLAALSWSVVSPAN